MVAGLSYHCINMRELQVEIIGEAKIIITKCAKVLGNTKDSFYVHSYYIRLDNGENFVYVNVVSVECAITCPVKFHVYRKQFITNHTQTVTQTFL